MKTTQGIRFRNDVVVSSFNAIDQEEPLEFLVVMQCIFGWGEEEIVGRVEGEVLYEGEWMEDWDGEEDFFMSVGVLCLDRISLRERNCWYDSGSVCGDGLQTLHVVGS